jgi:hypothetical protein
MAVLADLERLFERVFERSTARLFRAHPQAVQLERRVERAMERARSTQGGRTVVPARYRVRLHPFDLAEVAEAAGGPEALAGRLADGALAFARAHGYHLPDRPSVALVADPSVQPGVIEVDAVAARGPGGNRPPGPAPDVPGPGDPEPSRQVQPSPVPDIPVVAPRPAEAAVPAAPAEDLTAGTGAPGDPAGGWSVATVGPSRPAADPARPPASEAGGIRGDGTQTLVFRRPAPVPTKAVLRIIGRDTGERMIEVDGTPLTLGRASDNGLVLSDPRVSRHHARLQARRGTLVLTDLGSTNGSRVNGVRVDECALGMGDRVLLGDTVLLVEQLPG